MKKLHRLTALLTALIMLCQVTALASDGVYLQDLDKTEYDSLVSHAIEGTVPQVTEGSDVDEIEILPQEEIPVYSSEDTFVLEVGNIGSEKDVSLNLPRHGIVEITGNIPDGKWQIYADNQWITMPREENNLQLTYAKIVNCLGGQNKAKIRKISLDGTTVTDTCTVNVVEDARVSSDIQTVSIPAKMAPAKAPAKGGTAKGDMTISTITVNFVLEDMVTMVHPSKTIKITKNASLDPYTINFEPFVGYLPWIPQNTLPQYTQDTQADSITLQYASVPEDITVNIVYKPTNVRVSVFRYFENIDGTGFDENTAERNVITTYKTGDLIEVDDPDIANSYNGFECLLYECPTVAADGSTEIYVYYARKYYKLIVNLNGGHGMESIYDRYGTDLSHIGEPARTGYTFAGWKDNSGNTVTIPSSLTRDLTVTAQWTPANSHYRIAYYLQSPDNDTVYEYVDMSGEIPANAEDIITINDIPQQFKTLTYPIGSLDRYECNYAQYSQAATQTEIGNGVAVQGDGNTIVRVFFNRKKFSLRFYYAMSTGTGNQTRYYIAGGSTYKFGADGDNSANEITNLINYYAPGTAYTNAGVEEFRIGGTANNPVRGLPVTKADFNSKYTRGSVNSNGVTFYYFELENQSYGTDIRTKWPVQVMEPVYRNSSRQAGQWQDQTAYMAGWNPEHHVYYAWHNKANQTIKSKPAKLDYQLMFDNCGTLGNTEGHAGGNVGYYGEPDDDTLSFLCFWENGSSHITWNIPNLYHYNIWIPQLPGEDYTNLPENFGNAITTVNPDGTRSAVTKTYNNVNYYLLNTYDIYDDSEDQSAHPNPPITGYSPLAHTLQQNTTEVNTSVDKIFDADFYYTTNTYTLEFNDEGTVDFVLSGIPYNQVANRMMQGAKKNGEDYFHGDKYAPPYPADFDEGAYEFDGWYSSPNFYAPTKVLLGSEHPNGIGERMPARNGSLYAHWVKAHHNVTFYISKDELLAANPLTEAEGYPVLSVLHEEIVPEDQIPAEPRGGYNFIGWFYVDGDGHERMFDLATEPVMHDINLYAKWNTNVLVSYTIKYQDTLGNKIADDTTGTAIALTEKTFEPKGNDGLYPEYSVGYFPQVESHSMEMRIGEANEYIFVYDHQNPTPYTVYYKGKGTGIELHPPKTASNNTSIIVTESFVPITGYMPDNYQQRLILTIDGPNEITFWYTRDTVHAPYMVEHYIEKADGNGYELYREDSGSEDIGQNVTATAISIDNFAYNINQSNVYSQDVVQQSVKTDTQITAQMGEGGLDFKLYYDRLPQPYTVRYVERYSGNVVVPDKNGTGKFGMTVTETALDSIYGYQYDGWSAEGRTGDETQASITIKQQSAGEQVNVITFYYIKKTATINYFPVPEDGGTVHTNNRAMEDWESFDMVGGTPVGATAVPSDDDWRFAGWYSDMECSIKVSDDISFVPAKPAAGWQEETNYYAKFEPYFSTLTIIKQGAEDIDENQTFLFNVTGDNLPQQGLTVAIKGNSQVTLAGLHHGGTYTITEIGSWSWRYEPKTVVKTLDGDVNTVTIVNTRENEKWLDGGSFKQNIFGGN